MRIFVIKDKKSNLNVLYWGFIWGLGFFGFVGFVDIYNIEIVVVICIMLFVKCVKFFCIFML